MDKLLWMVKLSEKFWVGKNDDETTYWLKNLGSAMVT